jgi:hypothetical protein
VSGTAGIDPPWLEFGRAVLRAAHDDPNGDAAPVDVARSAVDGRLDDPGAFATLVANAWLDDDSAEVLAFLLAIEFDPSLQPLVAELRGDLARTRPTLGVLSVAFGPGHAGPLTVAPSARLRRARFVDVDTRGLWSDHVASVHPSVVWGLLGDASPDPDLPLGTVSYEPAASDPDASAVAAPLLLVVGRDRLRRRDAAAAGSVGERFLHAPPPADEAGWSALVREATITGCGLIVDVDGHLPPEGRRTIEEADHLAWAVSSPHPLAIDALPRRSWAEVVAPDHDVTDDEWHDLLGASTERRHGLSLDQLDRVAMAHSAMDGDIDDAIRRLAAGRLDQLTHRIRPSRGWDEIVLSPDRLALLESIVDRVNLAETVYQHWGFRATPSRGLVALFSGPSGTGKTLAAEVIAGRLGLDLFKLDLSAVVSKYIGETEKNLDEIFDAASAGNAVLFFDEADSLFGKRSEVNDARDRYANIEVSYLLQRLESHHGLVVLATNFEKNVDEAFLRRIHVRIEFALPAAEQRAAIWRQSFPATAPLSPDLDIDSLAERFEVTGGTIRNAAIGAAFAAAADGEPITLPHVMGGLVGEYRKLGRLITEKQFGEYTPPAGGS